MLDVSQRLTWTDCGLQASMIERWGPRRGDPWELAPHICLFVCLFVCLFPWLQMWDCHILQFCQMLCQIWHQCNKSRLKPLHNCDAKEAFLSFLLNLSQACLYQDGTQTQARSLTSSAVCWNVPIVYMGWASMFMLIQKDLQSINPCKMRGWVIIILGVRLFGIPVTKPYLFYFQRPHPDYVK